MAWGKDDTIITADQGRKLKRSQVSNSSRRHADERKAESSQGRKRSSGKSPSRNESSEGLKESKKTTSSFLTSREHTKLELVASRRRARELEQRLAGIESRKDVEVKEIRYNLEKKKTRLARMSLVEQELYFRRQEIQSLQQENASLSAKNEKLAIKTRDFRVNSCRLIDFSHGNRDYSKMLKMHHTHAQDENTKLVAMEKHYKRKVEKLQQDLNQGTAYIYAEHRLKKKLRSSVREALQKSAMGDDAELCRKTGKLFRSVEQYEEASEQPVPFPEKEEDKKDDEGKKTRRKSKYHHSRRHGLRKTKSFSKKSDSSPSSSKNKSSKRRSGARPENLDQGMHNSWNTV